MTGHCHSKCSALHTWPSLRDWGAAASVQAIRPDVQTGRWRRQGTCMCNGTWLRHKREQNEAICSNTVGPESEVRQRKTNMLWYHLHVESKVKVKSLSRVRLFATPWTVAYQDSPSMGFSRQEYWSGLLFPSPGDIPDPGIEPGSPALWADALLSEPPGKS